VETYVDILLERARMVREWRSYVAKIADSARRILPDARIYVFGSVVRGEATGGSDVDVLIVSKGVPRGNIGRAELRERIELLSGLPLHHPFEIHLVSEDEAEWYFARVEGIVEIG